MKTIFALILLMSSSAFAALPDQVVALRQFEGFWLGSGTVQSTGAPVINIKGYQMCHVVAAGWAVQCVGRWTGDQNFLLEESFQGAYDAATNRINWQVMYSQGPQAFTVTGLFNANKTELPLSRSFLTPNGTIDQNGTWTFLTAKRRTLFIDTKLNGNLIVHLTADVQKF